VPADAVICISCGFNLRTGAPVQTTTDEVEEEAEEEIVPTRGHRVLMFMGNWMPGLLRPVVLFLSVISAAVGLGLVALAAFLFSMGTILSAFLVGAAGVVVYGQALALLLGGDICFITNALVDFEGGQWPLFLILLLAPFVALFGYLKFFMLL